MKKLTRVIGIVAFCFVAMMGMSNVSNAATVGEVVTAPDENWNRYDDSDSKIVYTGIWTRFNNVSNYSGSDIYSGTAGSKASFKFFGTGLRVIAPINNDKNSDIIIKIDGEPFVLNEYASSLKFQVLCFEKIDLLSGYHTVEIIVPSNPLTTYATVIDAIDVIGYLVDDTNIDTDFSGSSSILEITMTNGTIKEYSLTIDELEAFLTWYDNRSDGTGKSYYRIPKKSNIKPFLSRKEYLSFDKIYSFEVKDYNE
ncbi:MAG: hypothetical protein ACERKN_21200 [Velocimicrobium sp.]